MRRETAGATRLDARRGPIGGAQEVRRETRDVRHVSSLSSLPLVSRLTSNALSPDRSLEVL